MTSIGELTGSLVGAYIGLSIADRLLHKTKKKKFKYHKQLKRLRK